MTPTSFGVAAGSTAVAANGMPAAGMPAGGMAAAHARSSGHLGSAGPMGTGPMGPGPIGTGPMGTGPLGPGPMGTGPGLDMLASLSSIPPDPLAGMLPSYHPLVTLSSILQPGTACIQPPCVYACRRRPLTLTADPDPNPNPNPNQAATPWRLRSIGTSYLEAWRRHVT